jgi:hypothetical protein
MVITDRSYKWHDRAWLSDTKNHSFPAISLEETFPKPIFELELAELDPKLHPMITMPFKN